MSPDVPATSGAEPFGKLFSAAFAQIKARSQPLLTVAVIIALIHGIVTLLPAILSDESVGVPQLAVFLVFVIALAVISFVGWMAYFVILIDGSTSAGAAMSRGLSLILPMIGVGIAVLIRSYIWVPLVILILGPVAVATTGLSPEMQTVFYVIGVAGALAVGLFRMPYYIPAPVLLVWKDLRWFANTAACEQGTRGYWGKLVGNTLLFSVCMIPVNIALAVIVGTGGAVLSSVGPALAASLWSAMGTAFGQQVISAFSTSFTVRLSQTVIEHPQSA